MSPDARVVPFRPATISTGGHEFVPLAASGRVANAATAEHTGAADRAREAGHAAGYAAGWAAGARAAADAAAVAQRALVAANARAEQARDAALGDAVAALDRATRATAARLTPVVSDAVRAVYEAALDLAEAVLERELVPGPDSARALLARAGALPADLGVHTVRVSPADHAQILAVLDVDAGVVLPEGIELVSDASLQPGDSLCEFPSGYLDARVYAGLERARTVLLPGAALGVLG